MAAHRVPEATGQYVLLNNYLSLYQKEVGGVAGASNYGRRGAG